jgi:hypothetical protein
MNTNDICRSYYQFERHGKTGYLKLKIIHKVLLFLLFILLIPTSILDILLSFFKKSSEIYVLKHTDKEPYNSIYQILVTETSYRLIVFPRFIFPILPYEYLIEIWNILKTNPIFFLKRINFYSALAWRLSKYNSLIRRERIAKLIVFQEYSFYMTYLTKLMESREGKLYNIQHGIPGDTYCFFRFTKCFIWGKFYQEEYIKNGADISQFVIAGSLFHKQIKKIQQKNIEDIDILYVMQGYAASKANVTAVLNLLQKLSNSYRVYILQHPRHNIEQTALKEFKGSITEAITRSNVIVSHYSTAMLDAFYLGKYSIAYIGENTFLRKYVKYLPKRLIIETIDNLEKMILTELSTNETAVLDNKYIDKTKNTIKVITNEINQDNTL